MALTASQLQEALTLATQYINKKIPDLLTASNYLYQLMLKRKKYVSGGTKIQMPINDAELLSQGFIDGAWDVISTNQNRQITYGEIDWKYFYWVVAITLDDMTKTHDTPEAIENMLMTKVRAAKSSVVRTLSSAMWASGTATNKKFNGFADIFAASGTAYAGINNTDVAAWLPEYNSTDQVPNYTNITKMIGTLRERTQMLGEQGNDFEVDLMLSRQRCIDAFKASEQIKQRFQDNKTLGSGFRGVEVDGITWLADANAPGTASTADNWVAVLSSNSFDLFYKYGFDGKEAPMNTVQVIPNQPVQIDVNYMVGNIGCTNRRVNGMLKTINA